MLSEDQIIRIILGFKLRHLRQQKQLSYQELAAKTGLSTSYLNDIEKGKRFPKPDKIAVLAQAFDVDYNYMVSTNASKKLQPIIDLLKSKFFKLFPLEKFGISLEKLLELFTQTPDKVNAFISTIFKIARNYQVDEQQFYLEALRSYQDMHNNYFPDLEDASRAFRKEIALSDQDMIQPMRLEDELKELYNISIDRKQLAQHKELTHIRSYFHPQKRILFLQKGLSPGQENFLLAREIGFQFLKIQERPYETTLLNFDTFEKLLNNYRASHFAASLLMEEHVLTEDIRKIARENSWKPELFLSLLDTYQVTAETLMQRFTNILPHHLGIEDLFFIRLTGSKDLKSFHMTKDLHLSQLHNPYNNELEEHYCNRWVSITSIKALQVAKQEKPIIADAQISTYWQTDKAYLCISLAKPAFRDASKGVSVTLGMLVSPQLKSIFHFISDPALKRKEVHTTCERCGIIDCAARGASPVIIEEKNAKDAVRIALEKLQ